MTMGSMDKRLNAIESSVVSLNRRMTPTRASVRISAAG
jgi:hypothetical protein